MYVVKQVEETLEFCMLDLIIKQALLWQSFV